MDGRWKGVEGRGRAWEDGRRGSKAPRADLPRSRAEMGARRGNTRSWEIVGDHGRSHTSCGRSWEIIGDHIYLVWEIMGDHGRSHTSCRNLSAASPTPGSGSGCSPAANAPAQRAQKGLRRDSEGLRRESEGTQKKRRRDPKGSEDTEGSGRKRKESEGLRSFTAAPVVGAEEDDGARWHGAVRRFPVQHVFHLPLRRRRTEPEGLGRTRKDSDGLRWTQMNSEGLRRKPRPARGSPARPPPLRSGRRRRAGAARRWAAGRRWSRRTRSSAREDRAVCRVGRWAA